jgi:hypothetical protein
MTITNWMLEHFLFSLKKLCEHHKNSDSCRYYDVEIEIEKMRGHDKEIGELL